MKTESTSRIFDSDGVNAHNSQLDSNHQVQVLVVGVATADSNQLIIALRKEGFSICSANDRRTAIELTSVQNFGAIVINLDFSQAGGVDVLRTVRRYNSGAAILVTTDRGKIDDRIAALELGADDFLIRPVTTTESVERIRTLVRRKQLKSMQVNRVADLTVDGSNQVVLRGEKRIELTKREFALLSYLASKNGAVVSRGELLERVFESESSSSSNVAEVYIRYLRQKIEIAGTSKLLHTFRGRGYMLGELDAVIAEKKRVEN